MEVFALLQQRLEDLQKVLGNDVSMAQEEVQNAFNALLFDLEDAVENKLISKDMLKQYDKVLKEFQQNPVEKIKELVKLNDEYLKK